MTAASGDNVVTWTTTHGDRVRVFPRWHWSDVHGHVVVEDWRWHVQARNNRILEQGEGHPSKRNAVRAALRHHPRVETT